MLCTWEVCQNSKKARTARAMMKTVSKTTNILLRLPCSPLLGLSIWLFARAQLSSPRTPHSFDCWSHLVTLFLYPCLYLVVVLSVEWLHHRMNHPGFRAVSPVSLQPHSSPLQILGSLPWLHFLICIHQQPHYVSWLHSQFRPCPGDHQRDL